MGWVTLIRPVVRMNDAFKMVLGLHQGSALSHFFFAMGMDKLTDEIRQEAPWTMMFADDILICSEGTD